MLEWQHFMLEVVWVKVPKTVTTSIELKWTAAE